MNSDDAFVHGVENTVVAKQLLSNIDTNRLSFGSQAVKQRVPGEGVNFREQLFASANGILGRSLLDVAEDFVDFVKRLLRDFDVKFHVSLAAWARLGRVAWSGLTLPGRDLS